MWRRKYEKNYFSTIARKVFLLELASVTVEICFRIAFVCVENHELGEKYIKESQREQFDIEEKKPLTFRSIRKTCRTWVKQSMYASIGRYTETRREDGRGENVRKKKNKKQKGKKMKTYTRGKRK